MAGVQVRDFDAPDESRTPDKTKVDIVRMGGTSVSRFTLQPGWSWADCIKPIVGGETCQQHHVGICEGGRMRIRHEDGTEQEIAAGQTYVIEPGHLAEIVGDESFVGFEFDSRTAEEFARV